MAHRDRCVDEGLRHLKQRVALFALFEEAMIRAFVEATATARRDGHQDEADYLDDVIQRHRDGLSQHRALMSVSGLGD